MTGSSRGERIFVLSAAVERGGARIEIGQFFRSRSVAKMSGKFSLQIATSAVSRRRRADFQMHAGLFLQHPDDLRQIGRGRIAARTEHPHEALGRYSRGFGQRWKAGGRIDEVAQYRARRADVALDQGLHRFLEQRLPEFRIGFDLGFDVVLETACQRHLWSHR